MALIKSLPLLYFIRTSYKSTIKTYVSNCLHTPHRWKTPLSLWMRPKFNLVTSSTRLLPAAFIAFLWRMTFDFISLFVNFISTGFGVVLLGILWMARILFWSSYMPCFCKTDWFSVTRQSVDSLSPAIPIILMLFFLEYCSL